VAASDSAPTDAVGPVTTAAAAAAAASSRVPVPVVRGREVVSTRSSSTCTTTATTTATATGDDSVRTGTDADTTAAAAEPAESSTWTNTIDVEPTHSGWTCAVCTLQNAAADPSCLACETPLENEEGNSSSSSGGGGEEAGFACPQCTFTNTHSHSAHSCEVCGYGEDEVRPPDTSFRDRLVGRAVGGRGGGSSGGNYSSGSSGDDDDGNMWRVAGCALLGAAVGGVASMFGAGGSSRSFARMALEGAALGATTGALAAESQELHRRQRPHHGRGPSPTRGRVVVRTSMGSGGGAIPNLQFDELLRRFFSNDRMSVEQVRTWGFSRVENVDIMSHEELLARIGAMSGQGVRLRAADSSSIASLPSAPLLEDSLDESGEPNECSICLEPLVKGADCSRLPCAHTYHTACVAEWLRHVNTCPVCKTSI